MRSLRCAPATLNGDVSENKCQTINFVTGEGVDRTPPIVKINHPGQLEQGGSYPITINITDDVAVQNVILTANGQYILGSKNFSENGLCETNVTADIIWNTAGYKANIQHTLVADAFDQASLRGVTSTDVSLLPSHCFNGIKDENMGETDIDCGGICKGCVGSGCNKDFDCSRGTLCIDGVCTRVMRILGISPNSGAPKNYMSIFGENFGTTPGTVWFSKDNSPNSIGENDWVEATVVTCGKTSKNWFDKQIVVEVPENFYYGSEGASLMVSGNGFVANTVRNETKAFFDPYSNKLRFVYDVAKAGWPTLCMVEPFEFSSFQSNIGYTGKNFGTYINDGNYHVYYNVYNERISNPSMNISVGKWGEALANNLYKITGQSPRLENGSFSTYVFAGGKESNNLRVRINNTFDSTAPIINKISPNSGAKGEYITISGQNFGPTRGYVRFYKKPVNKLSEDIYWEGNFDFMDACVNDVWSDKKIIVKFPSDSSLINPQEYEVVVFNKDGKSNLLHKDTIFNLNQTTPRPGICSIKPLSGPIGKNLEIYGENFGTDKNVLKMYFWQDGANINSTVGRTSSTVDNLENVFENSKNVGQKITGKVPINSVTGPVVAGKDAYFSNSIDFTVFDCTKNENKCLNSSGVQDENKQCCTTGLDKGMCIPKEDLCAGSTRATGYMWRFTTAVFPDTPKVIEQCVDYVEGQPYVTPSPAPSTLHKHIEACKNSLVTIGITTALKDTTVNDNNVLIYKCTEGIGLNQNVCKSISGSKYGYTITLETLNANNDSLIKITPNSGNWEKGYYQVILRKNISSNDTNRPQELQASQSCDGIFSGITNTAYCYTFGIGEQSCELSGVAINPNDYWTGVLESPIMRRVDRRNMEEIPEKPVVYSSSGIANEKCLLMNTTGYNYGWSSQRTDYATVDASFVNNSTTTINSLKNTVAVGLVSPEDGLNINSTISTSTPSGLVTKTGVSYLKIDLSNPQITEHAPKCFTACPNAQIYVKFDKQMSNNIKEEGFSLDKCFNTDCSQKVSEDIKRIDPLYSNSRIIGFIIVPSSSILSFNSFYKVNIASNSVFTMVSTTNFDSRAISPRGSPYKQDYSWIFGTKDKICDVAKVEVSPLVYNAFFIGDRGIYRGDLYSTPDECDPKGQKLNSNDYNWLWTTSNSNIAKIYTFFINGRNPFCGSDCLKRGSTISSGTFAYNVPMCGNGELEAGEDCELSGNPFAEGNNCGIDCLFKDKDKEGSCLKDENGAEDCRLCYDEIVSTNEDCDRGIIFDPPNPLIVSSSLNCADNCLHTGTPLSTKWCSDNYASFHGDGEYISFKQNFEEACKKSVSQCGNGKLEPDEECEVGDEGCTNDCLFVKTKKGSSLLNEIPTLCGDGNVTGEEDGFCETSNLYDFSTTPFITPWVLAEAVGLSYNPDTYKQTADITGQAVGTGKSGVAKFNLICGAVNDDQCNESGRKPIGSGSIAFGVGKNSCCYPRPVMTSTYPIDGTNDVCPNTQIKISFDKPIDVATLQGNLLIAREYLASDNFCTTTNIITSEIVPLSFLGESLPWYKKIWTVAVGFVQKIFNIEKVTAQWCAGEVSGVPTVTYNTIENVYDVTVKLEKQLLGENTTYKVLLREGIRDDKGVSIGKREDGKPLQFSFTTWPEKDVCKVGSVNIIPNKVRFTETNSSAVLNTFVKAENLQIIEPIGAYSWNYAWSKDGSGAFRIDNSSIISTSTVTANNQNGVGNVFVTVSTTDPNDKKPVGSSQITVFLCENPWPPFEVKKENGSFVDVWPFDDTANNNDYFDFNYNPEVTKTGFNGQKNNSTDYTNFSTYYCADAGASGFNDDLPYMKPVVTTTADTNVLRYFLLTHDKNADAIGVKVFKNLDYLTLNDWLKNNIYNYESNRFNTLKIDGYEAVVDQTGNNVYIAALNVSSTVYSNIYLFSLSAYANADTKKVFDQILTNLKFNANLDDLNNLKACAEDYSDTSPEGRCNTDLDCLTVPGKPICLNQKDKMQRNYQRLQDLKIVSSSLISYFDKENKYPNIENTFLTNRANSIWQSSWIELGGKLSRSIPFDPINKLAPAGTCYKDPNTFCIIDEQCSNINFTSLPIGLWEAENNYNDSSSFKITSTQRGGVVFGDGVGSGKSFLFNGQTNNYLEIASSTNYLTGEFSISFWFKPTDDLPAVLVKQGGWTEDANRKHSLGGFMVEFNKVYFGTDGKAQKPNKTIRFAIFPNSNDDWYYALDSQTPLLLNKWHHIVVKYNSNNQIMSLFINNSPVNTSVKVGNPDAVGFHKDATNKIKGESVENIIIGQGLKGNMDKIYFYPSSDNIKVENLYKHVCQIHDPVTGWSAEDMRFSFACGNKSLAYSYRLDGNNFNIRATKEDDGLAGNVWDRVKNIFGLNDSAKINFSDFCENSIYSNVSARCGNGILNDTEECDPPGKINYNLSPCPASGNVVEKRECRNDCQYGNPTFVSCRTAVEGTCGDGIIQYKAGEECDDGENNGKIGFCSGSCQLVSEPVCGNGILDEGEYCDTVNYDCVFNTETNVDKHQNYSAYFLVDASNSMQNTLGSGEFSRWDFLIENLPKTMKEITNKNIKYGMSLFTTHRIRYLNKVFEDSTEMIYFAPPVPDEGVFCEEPCRLIFNDKWNDPQDPAPHNILEYTEEPPYLYEILEYNFQNENKINEFKNYFRPSGNTPTAAAMDIIIKSKYTIKQEPLWDNLGKNIILVTDGTPTESNIPNTSPIDATVLAIEEAGKKGIKVSIFGIDFGDENSPLVVAARNTGGIFKKITSVEDSNSFLEDILSVIQGEECKEYHAKSGYSCAWNCKGPGGYCGDGKINGPEECDDGINNGSNKRCNQYCQISETLSEPIVVIHSSCGDKILTNEEIEEKGHECDNGPLNGTLCTIPQGFSSCSWCSTDCKIRWNECPAGQFGAGLGICCDAGETARPGSGFIPYCSPIINKINN